MINCRSCCQSMLLQQQVYTRRSFLFALQRLAFHWAYLSDSTVTGIAWNDFVHFAQLLLCWRSRLKSTCLHMLIVGKRKEGGKCGGNYISKVCVLAGGCYTESQSSRLAGGEGVPSPHLVFKRQSRALQWRPHKASQTFLSSRQIGSRCHECAAILSLRADHIVLKAYPWTAEYVLRKKHVLHVDKLVLKHLLRFPLKTWCFHSSLS